MDVESLKKKKEALELQINELIDRFEAETNVEVNSVYLSRKIDTMITDQTMYVATTYIKPDDKHKNADISISLKI